MKREAKYLREKISNLQADVLKKCQIIYIQNETINMLNKKLDKDKQADLINNK